MASLPSLMTARAHMKTTMNVKHMPKLSQNEKHPKTKKKRECENINPAIKSDQTHIFVQKQIQIHVQESFILTLGGGSNKSHWHETFTMYIERNMQFNHLKITLLRASLPMQRVD